MATTKTNRRGRAATKTTWRYSTAAVTVHEDPDLFCVRVSGLVTRSVATALMSDIGGILRSRPEAGVVWLLDSAVMALDPNEMTQATVMVHRQTHGAFMVSGCVVHADFAEWVSAYSHLCARHDIFVDAFHGLREAVMWTVKAADLMVDQMADVRYDLVDAVRLSDALHRRAHLAAERIAKAHL